MAAYYDFKEKPNPKGDGEKQPLYPRIVSQGTISTKTLIEDISDKTTFSAGELLGAIRLISDRLAHYVNEGYSVELEEIGFFTASLAARPVMDKKEIRSTSVRVDGVNFRMSKGLKEKLRSSGLVRAKYGFKRSSTIPIEKRKAILDTYLKENPFITRKKYSELTGLLVGLAVKDLDKWVEEGYLKVQGRKSTKIFLSNKEAESLNR